MESHGKRQYQKSWKSKNFSLTLAQSIVTDMIVSKIVQFRISHEKFVRIPSVEMVMENRKFYLNLRPKYSYGYNGF